MVVQLPKDDVRGDNHHLHQAIISMINPKKDDDIGMHTESVSLLMADSKADAAHHMGAAAAFDGQAGNETWTETETEIDGTGLTGMGGQGGLGTPSEDVVARNEAGEEVVAGDMGTTSNPEAASLDLAPIGELQEPKGVV